VNRFVQSQDFVRCTTRDRGSKDNSPRIRHNFFDLLSTQYKVVTIPVMVDSSSKDPFSRHLHFYGPKKDNSMLMSANLHFSISLDLSGEDSFKLQRCALAAI
jgi:hypothetical protein